MRIDPQRLAAQLAERLLPVYVISGDEPLQVLEAADAVRARARAEGASEREVFFVERGNAGWQPLIEAAQSRSLFSARRLIEIRLSGKPGAAGAPALKRLFQMADAELLILVISGRLEREAQQAEWLLAAQQRGAWVPVWPIDRARLPQWLRTRFATAGLVAESAAVELLAERSEGNLLAAKQEIDKLALLLPQGARVTAADVAASSAESARYNVMQLADAVQAGDATRALRVLMGLRAEGGEALLALWALLRALRGPGDPHRRTRLAELTARAARADRMAKGLAAGDVWDELLLLAGELCGRRALPLVPGGAT